MASKQVQPQGVIGPDGQSATVQNVPWKYDAGSDEFVAPPTPEYPMGRRSGNIAKRNAANSLDYLVSQFIGTDEEPGPVKTTPQGGWLGMRGQIGKVTDTQKAKRFGNLKEQLSTELRTLFRIPGEGTLSDKEQAQYGIQLPDVANSETTNRKILNDIQERVRLRNDLGANPLISPKAPTEPPPKKPKLENVTIEDVQYTARKYGISTEEAKRRLGL
jgi:hypothetical protein